MAGEPIPGPMYRCPYHVDGAMSATPGRCSVPGCPGQMEKRWEYYGAETIRQRLDRERAKLWASLKFLLLYQITIYCDEVDRRFTGVQIYIRQKVVSE
eukprot:g43016.t1